MFAGCGAGLYQTCVNTFVRVGFEVFTAVSWWLPVFRDMTRHCISGSQRVLLLCLEVTGANKNVKTCDITHPLTQQCSITSLKIVGIIICPCLHGHFTEVNMFVFYSLYQFFFLILNFFVTVMEGIPATKYMLLLSTFTSAYTCCSDVSCFIL